MGRGTARAKINLTLHVGRPIADASDPFYRYHPLDSLVVFAAIADQLSVKPSDQMSLEITGPFADQIPKDEDNLVFKTIRATERAAEVPLLAFHLEKNLPVAAGIGGGSANAAATIRLLQGYVSLGAKHWSQIALGLGADVPVCLVSETSRMTGIGDSITPLPGLGILHAVLVNPGKEISTPKIFSELDKGRMLELPKPQVMNGKLLERARAGNNDLQPVSEKQTSIIIEVIDALNACENCEMARMSGSGATCFGLFSSETAPARAAKVIKADHPEWWVQATTLGEA